MTVYNNRPVTTSVPLAIPQSPLKDRLQNIAQQAIWLGKLADGTYQDPMGALTGVLTTATGLANICAGNLGTGTVYTGVGLGQLYKVYFGGKVTDLQALLQDARASTDMLKILQGENGKSLTKLEEQQKFVDSHLDKIQFLLKEIDAIALQGDVDLAKHKLAAQASCQEAMQKLQEVKKHFAQGIEAVSQGDHYFAMTFQAVELLQSIILREGKPEDKLEEVQKISKNILEFAEVGQQNLAKAGQLLQGGLELLDKAISSELAGVKEYGAAVAYSQEALQKIRSKEQECERIRAEGQAKIKQSQAEIENMKRLNADAVEILNDLEDKLVMAEKLAGSRFTYSEVLVGGWTAVGAAALVGVGSLTGALTVASAPIVGALAFRSRKEIASVAKRIFYGAETDIVKNPTHEAPIQFEFKQQSTGWWNAYVVGTGASKTEGEMKIRLPNGKMIKTTVNLNNPGDKIPLKDTIAMIKEMKGYIEELQKNAEKHPALQKNVKEAAEQSLKVINGLKNFYFERGSQHSNCSGVVDKNSVYLRPLERAFQKLVESVPKA